jgi:UDP-glucose:(glucosyl)LPS alpha-1,2-glucosyltransferase
LEFIVFEKIDPNLLDHFQFVKYDTEDLDHTRYRIFLLQDMLESPAVRHLDLANEGWRRFHRLVFQSNWQAQWFIYKYKIPWSKCLVMLDAIDPVTPVQHDNDRKRLVYHAHVSGLQVLVPVFEKLLERHDDIQLNIYSDLSNWAEMKKAIEDKPHIYVFPPDKDAARNALANSDIFAYPATIEEPGNRQLMEAMSAGLLCVHPNLGSLFEISTNWTIMYNWTENMAEHARLCYGILEAAFNMLTDPATNARRQSQKSYVDLMYNNSGRTQMWEAFFKSMLLTKEPKEVPGDQFIYKPQQGANFNNGKLN